GSSQATGHSYPASRQAGDRGGAGAPQAVAGLTFPYGGCGKGGFHGGRRATRRPQDAFEAGSCCSCVTGPYVYGPATLRDRGTRWPGRPRSCQAPVLGGPALAIGAFSKNNRTVLAFIKAAPGIANYNHLRLATSSAVHQALASGQPAAATIAALPGELSRSCRTVTTLMGRHQRSPKYGRKHNMTVLRLRGLVPLASLAAALTLALAACGSSSTSRTPSAPRRSAKPPGSATSRNIVWWASPITTSTPDPRTVLINDFEKVYPNIHVTLRSAPTDTDTNRASLITQI